MFLLLMILLNPAPIPGLDRVYLLSTFDTAEECQVERNRIGFEMAESYPYENDFLIVCELNTHKEA